MEATIEVKNLKKKFVKKGIFRKRVREVLKGVSFEVFKETFGFIGPNGAGKTTTIKLIMGFLRPDSGSVRVLGRHIEEAKAFIGFLPERPYIYSSIKAIEFLNFCFDVFSIPYYERRRKAKELLELVGLLGKEEEPISSFSKGMVQRLLFASTLVNDPEVLILDEPMSGLDPVGRSMIAEVILELRRKGKTVFYSSHIIQDVERLSDRVAVIVDGQIKLMGKVGEIVNRYLKGYRITYREGRELLTAEVGKEELWRKLEELKSKRVELISVEPLRLTLEEVFVRLVKGESLEELSSSQVNLQ